MKTNITESIEELNELRHNLEKRTINTRSPNGNAYAIMITVSDILKQIHGEEESKPIIEEYIKEAMSSNYEHLKETSLKYANREFPNDPILQFEDVFDSYSPFMEE